MNPEDLNPSELRKHAVHWLTRMHSGHATPEDIDACEVWRQSHPERDRMYRSVAYFWDASAHLPEERLRAILDQPDRSAARWSPARRRFGLGLAGACALGIAAAVALPAFLSGERQYEAGFMTQRGERREVALLDGSRLSLNVETQVEVALYDRRRVVELMTGEAFFEVEPDAQRPFLVQAGGTVVEVTGTRFNVRHERDRVEVSVESGSVEVTSGSWPSRRRERLGSGQHMEIDAREGVAKVENIHTQNLAAWRGGKVIFDDEPLENVVAEMNRYLPQAARLDAPHLRDYRVAGVFNIDEPQAMIAALPAIAPVDVLRLPDGRIRIVGR